MALIGPRRVGKTTLALEEAQTRSSACLDLWREADRAEFGEPERHLAEHADELR